MFVFGNEAYRSKEFPGMLSFTVFENAVGTASAGRRRCKTPDMDFRGADSNEGFHGRVYDG